MEVEGKKRFPLMEAYRFASEKGQESQAIEIKEMEIEWDRSYNSSVRRGRLIRLFESHGLLPEFIERYWPYGATSLGESERRRCLRISDDYDNFLSGSPRETVAGEPVTDIESFEFALEAHLRDFLAKNLEQVEAGLRLHETEGKSAVEFTIDGGRIDILAVDRDERYVVIELKLSNGRNKALGQLLYYMGWVDRNLGKGQCRGIIVANEISDELAIAVDLPPIFSTSLKLVKSAFEGRSGHEEAIHGRADHRLSEAGGSRGGDQGSVPEAWL